MDFFALEKGRKGKGKRGAHVPRGGAELRRHLPSARGAARSPAGSGRGRAGEQLRPPGGGPGCARHLAPCACPRACPRRGPPAARTDGPLEDLAQRGAGPLRVLGPQSARAPRLARSPHCRARPPSGPGRGASVHTRGFFKNNIFLDRPPPPFSLFSFPYDLIHLHVIFTIS